VAGVANSLPPAKPRQRRSWSQGGGLGRPAALGGGIPKLALIIQGYARGLGTGPHGDLGCGFVLGEAVAEPAPATAFCPAFYS
jgi:hypothetical protein